MKPLLFSSTETAWTTHGLGPIEAVSCTVREELNGKYELELELPAESKRAAEIGARSQILVKPNPYDQTQPFRIYQERRKMNRLITEYARHISYDLDGIPVATFRANSASEAVTKIGSYSLIANPFTFSTDLSVNGLMESLVPTVARALLGEQDESLLKVYGGELQFDRRSVQLLQRRGADRGFVIAYGKNLTDVNQEKNIAEMYTGVLPYWTGGDGAIVSGTIQNAPGTWNYSRILPVDLSSEFDEQPTGAQLNAAAQAYITREKIGVPKVTIKASFVPPGSVGIHALEDVRLGDTVTVRFLELGIDVQASVTAYTYDVLNERYTSIEVGDRPETAARALTDAGRLSRGKLKGDKLEKHSVGGGGGGALKKNSVTQVELNDHSVTVNKIVDGAVESVKIKDGAVTGNKVLDAAINYAKLAGDVQVLFTDILAANRIFAGVISADMSVSCSTIVVSGTQYLPGSISFVDGMMNVRKFYVLKEAGT